MRRISEDRLASLCLAFEVDGVGTNWFSRQMPKGQREKYELRPLRAKPPVPAWQWFWKSSVPRAPLEFWSEVLAFHIGGVIGVEVPPCFPSLKDGRWGVLTASFLAGPDEMYVEGGDILAALDDQYDRNYGERQSIQLIYNALEEVGLGEQKERFFETLLLDGLTGNQDRHHENWGVIIKPFTHDGEGFQVNGITPAFDNGASLLKELRNDEELLRRVGSPELIDAYISKGKSEIRWQENEVPERMTHVEFIRRHLQTYPWSREIARNLLEFDVDEMNRAIARIGVLSQTCEPMALTVYRMDRIVRIVKQRRMMILEML